MEIINVKLDELKPYENNPRINEESIDYVANSIKEFGFKVPLVIDENKYIVTGHTRYLACKQLGIKEVPCIVSNDLTEKQNKLFRVIDNKVSEFSRWDYDLLDKEIAELKEEGIDLQQYGFENEEDNFDFIDEVLGSGIAGEGTTPDIDKISIAFDVIDSTIVNTVISQFGKEEIINKVLERIED